MMKTMGMVWIIYGVFYPYIDQYNGKFIKVFEIHCFPWLGNLLEKPN